MNSCNQKSCRYHVQFKIALALLQLLMNNQKQFVSLWRCVLPDFVVQRNNFFRLVFPFSVIHKTIGKKLISKTIKRKLDNSSKVQFAFFYPDNIQFLQENYQCFRKSGNYANSSGWASNSCASVCTRYCTKQVPYPFPQRQLICERYMKGYFALSHLLVSDFLLLNVSF